MGFFDKFFNKTTNVLEEKEGFWKKLLDKNNEKVSSTNFFVLIVSGVGVILLMVPIFILCNEAWFNHTITTDLNGIAAYIGAVSTMFVTVGATKAFSNHSDNKLKLALAQCQEENEQLRIQNEECMGESGEVIEEESPEEIIEEPLPTPKRKRRRKRKNNKPKDLNNE